MHCQYTLDLLRSLRLCQACRRPYGLRTPPGVTKGVIRGTGRHPAIKLGLRPTRRTATGTPQYMCRPHEVARLAVSAFGDLHLPLARSQPDIIHARAAADRN